MINLLNNNHRIKQCHYILNYNSVVAKVVVNENDVRFALCNPL